MTESDLVELVMRARDGDHMAWERLVARFDRYVAKIARSYRLADCDVDDVVQITLMRLYESISRLRSPERLPSWLATTTRRECLRLLRTSAREAPTEQMTSFPDCDLPAPGDELLDREAHDVLRAAVDELPDRHRRLLVTLMAVEQPAYADVARQLDMPVGSIGPTRARGIDRLRRHPRIAALAA